jgi:hypothetical protein
MTIKFDVCQGRILCSQQLQEKSCDQKGGYFTLTRTKSTRLNHFWLGRLKLFSRSATAGEQRFGGNLHELINFCFPLSPTLQIELDSDPLFDGCACLSLEKQVWMEQGWLGLLKNVS